MFLCPCLSSERHHDGVYADHLTCHCRIVDQGTTSSCLVRLFRRISTTVCGTMEQLFPDYAVPLIMATSLFSSDERGFRKGGQVWKESADADLSLALLLLYASDIDYCGFHSFTDAKVLGNWNGFASTCTAPVVTPERIIP